MYFGIHRSVFPGKVFHISFLVLGTGDLHAVIQETTRSHYLCVPLLTATDSTLQHREYICGHTGVVQVDQEECKHQ